MWRHYCNELEILAVIIIAKLSCEVTKLYFRHKFIEAHSCVLSDQKFFSKLAFRKQFFQEFDEVFEQFSVQCISYKNSFFSVFIQLFEKENLLCLELIQIFINSGAFYSFVLAEVSLFQIIVFDHLLRMPKMIVEIIYSMTEFAIRCIINT